MSGNQCHLVSVEGMNLWGIKLWKYRSNCNTG